MRGVLTPEQQMNVLSRIWGLDREGCVFLPRIPGWCRTKEDRRNNYREGRAYAWPSEAAAILEFLTQHQDDDIYFAPCLFGTNRRLEDNAEPERALWADLDHAAPDSIPDEYKPTICWESSPGRYQAVWLLTHPRQGLSWPGYENHRLTAFLGADPSGWDTTQLLRVPGRRNHKPEYKTPQQGQLLWDQGPRYTADDFADLPQIDTVLDAGDLDALTHQFIKDVDRHAVWARVKLKVSRRVREYMGVRNATVADDAASGQSGGRSSIMWMIERELADAGCTVAEIVAVVQPTVWNKHKGQPNELQQLTREALKAAGAKGKKPQGKLPEDTGTPVTPPSDGDGAFTEVTEEDASQKPGIQWLQDIARVSIPRPAWLINNVWSQGGCGFIAGDPKSYKSWMGLDMALSLATGEPFLNDPQFFVVGGPRRVLYIQEEDSDVVVRDRLEKVLELKNRRAHWHGYVTVHGGAVTYHPTPLVHLPMGYYVRKGFTTSDPAWQLWLAELVEVNKFDHVVIDTMGTTAGDVDTDRAPEVMSKILRPLKDITTRTGAGFSIVHHNRKGSDNGQRGGSRMLGSVSLHAWVDDAMYVTGRENLKNGNARVRVERESKQAPEHRWLVEIPRMSRPGDLTAPWAPVTGMWNDDDPTPVGSDEPRKVRERGKAAGAVIVGRVRLMNGTEQRPLLPDRIADVQAMPIAEVIKQLSAALENGLLEGSLDTGVWASPRART